MHSNHYATSLINAMKICENFLYPHLSHFKNLYEKPLLTRGFFIYSQEAIIVMEDSSASISDFSDLEEL